MTRVIAILTIVGLAAPVGALASPAPRAADRPVETVAATEYLFAERGVFELLAAPGRITDVILEPGETLVEANPIAAGDTVRWVIGDTTSGEGPSRRVHVLVKPVQPGLSTNLIINTSRRSYHLVMRASPRAYLSQVVWRYPQAPSTAPIKPAVLVTPPIPPAPTPLNLGYRITGEGRWRPERVYDDGARTYVEFGPAIVLTDLPPIYVLGAGGKSSELINYRVEGRRLVVERLFDRADLRFGLKRWERRIRIERTAPGREADR